MDSALASASLVRSPVCIGSSDSRGVIVPTDNISIFSLCSPNNAYNMIELNLDEEDNNTYISKTPATTTTKSMTRDEGEEEGEEEEFEETSEQEDEELDNDTLLLQLSCT